MDDSESKQNRVYVAVSCSGCHILKVFSTKDAAESWGPNCCEVYEAEIDGEEVNFG